MRTALKMKTTPKMKTKDNPKNKVDVNKINLNRENAHVRIRWKPTEVMP